MVDSGCDVIEIGLPYSDPVMDGPTIQAAAQRALEGGVRTTDVLRTVEAVAATGTPTLVMTYWNPVERYGVERFAADLASAGGAGLITPDLTPDSADAWIAAADAHDLDKVFLVAPSSTDARLRYTTDACRGFIYATAVMGVTGARTSTSELAGPLVERTRAGHRPADRRRARRLQRRPGRRGGGVRRRSHRRVCVRPRAAGRRRPGRWPEGAGLAHRGPRRRGAPWLEALALALLMMFVLVGCGSSGDDGPAVTGVSSSDDDGYNGILLDEPYAVPDLTLTDTDNQPFDLAKQTRRTLVFFGYTNCPDICQVVMSTIARRWPG